MAVLTRLTIVRPSLLLRCNLRVKLLFYIASFRCCYIAHDGRGGILSNMHGYLCLPLVSAVFEYTVVTYQPLARFYLHLHL